MAATEPLSILTDSPLTLRLAQALSSSVTCRIHHLSTPPVHCAALYSPPPGQRALRTYCMSHFLAISIDGSSSKKESRDVECGAEDILVFAIEVLVYSTARDTTFFVSKADSTGYLHLLNLPPGQPSPLRSISAVFLSHLLERHHRPGLRSIVSLFARAQDQYLFPGSVENEKKHVLDDRGLIKWWCKVLDELVLEQSSRSAQGGVKAYLTVPGLDTHEARAHIPPEARTSSRWKMGHPLMAITTFGPSVPPRCLIPRFPDDPKARYLDELDEEIAHTPANQGSWKSVQSIDQFWEMMAYRQECSAGRLVGFIWVVLEPAMQQDKNVVSIEDSQQTMVGDSQDSERTLYEEAVQREPVGAANGVDKCHAPSDPLARDATSSKSMPGPKSSRVRLRGVIRARQPRFKTDSRGGTSNLPEATAYYSWPRSSRGQVVASQSDYKRMLELLLQLDFANRDIAQSSSRRWIDEARALEAEGANTAWGASITGVHKTDTVSHGAEPTQVNVLNTMMVRKKRKESPATEEASTVAKAPVNVLASNMVRKKMKTPA